MEQKEVKGDVGHANIVREIVTSVYGSLKTPTGRAVMSTLPSMMSISTGPLCTIIMTHAPIVYEGGVVMRRHPTIPSYWLVTHPSPSLFPNYRRHAEIQINAAADVPVILLSATVQEANKIDAESVHSTIPVAKGITDLHVRVTIRHIMTQITSSRGRLCGKISYDITYIAELPAL